MELLSPFRSSPCTPKPRARNLNTTSPPYKSNATVISLDSSPVREPNAYEIEDRTHDYLSRQQDQYNDNDSEATQIPDLTEYSHPPNTPMRTSYAANTTPVKPLRPRTFVRHQSETDENIPQTLDHMVLSLPTANPPITVLLVLTPKPASLAETTAFEAFSSRFCSDFGTTAEWNCISLYAHFRKWATARKLTSPNPLGIRGEDKLDIGGVHPYALRAKLDQEEEVQWRLTVPVLKTLIDSEVKKGSRAFVICGLAVGDVGGVRAFGRTIAEPSGILAFLPTSAPAPLATQVVPLEYHSRTVSIASAPPSHLYNTSLAALYAKQLSSGRATHSDQATKTASST
ncbi:hypothetical protein MBLNU13_g06959t1 [Cladosporium sp. NU13]